MKKLMAVLLSVLLLLGVCSVAAYAEEAPAAPEAAVAAQEEVPAAQSEAQTRYLVLGDSIAYGSGLANPRAAVYGKIVADTNGYAYENYAVPFHTTAKLMRRMEESAVAAAIRQADIISISIGGNNLLLDNPLRMLYDGIVLGDFTRVDRILKDFYQDLAEIVTRIHRANPTVVIVLQTVYNPQTGAIGEVYQEATGRLSATIERFVQAQAEGVLLADVRAALTDHAHDFAEDGIHPSVTGNEKIARVILQTLAAAGLGTETEPVIQTPGLNAHGLGPIMFLVSFIGPVFRGIALLRSVLLQFAV